MSELGTSLIWCAIQASLLALLAFGLGARPWRIGGSTGPLVCLCSIIVLTIFSFVPLPVSLLGHSFGNGERSGRSASTTKPSQTEIQSIANYQVEENLLTESPVEATANMKSQPKWADFVFEEFQSATVPNHPGWQKSPVPSIVVGIFVLGFALGFARLLLGLVGARQLIHTGKKIADPRLEEALIVLQAELSVKQPIELYETDKLTSAATLGVRRPVILMPVHWREWDDHELNAVLAHELAHVARRDFATHLLSQLGVVLHFYNPLIHWLAGRLRLEQELAADSKAASLAGGERRYLRVLAKLALDHENHNVGWPARAFLPTRQTFLRRLEMLKHAKTSSGARSGLGPMTACLVIGFAAFVLLGLKPSRQVMAQAQAAPATSAQYDMRFVSEDADSVIAARPAEILKTSKGALIYEQLKQIPGLGDIQARFGAQLQDIEQVIVGIDSTAPANGPKSLFLQSSKPLGTNSGLGVPKKQGDATIIDMPQGLLGWLPNEKTLVVCDRASVERFIKGGTSKPRVFETELWKQVKDRPIAISIDGKVARTFLQPMLQNPNMAMVSSILNPVSDEAVQIAFGASLAKEFKINGWVQCRDAGGAKKVESTLTAAVVLSKNALDSMRKAFASQPAPPSPSPDVIAPKELVEKLYLIGSKLLESTETKSDGATARIGMQVDADSIPLEPLMAGVAATRKAAQRSTSANNLKQIVLAFHNYNEAYKQFPNSANTGDPSAPKKFPYSWRVAILPYIEQTVLYNMYRFDEPWDSAHNLEVAKAIPSIYRHPGEEGMTTSYVLITGDKTMFNGKDKPLIQNVTDGTSNTIMLVEAATNIPWTKPEDFEYAGDKPLPKFGGYSPEGFNAAFVDGSVKFIAQSIDEKILRALLTATGGEVLN